MDANLTNISHSSVPVNQTSLGPEFTGFIIVVSIVLIAIIIFDGLLIITLLLSTSVAVPVRVLLINLLTASLITAVISLSSTFKSVTLIIKDTLEPSLPFCRFVIWVFSIALEARLIGLVAFSVMVLKMVTSSMREIGVKWLMCSLVVTWVIALVSGIDNIIPPIYGVQNVGGVACFPAKGYPQYEILSLTYFVLWITIGCFLPLLVCIFIPLATLCYIKRHTITEGAQYKKAMAKFAAFLITGNVMNVLGQVVPAIVAVTLTDVVGVYLSYTISLLSLIPTPILIVLFLKPVHRLMARLMCKKRPTDKYSTSVPRPTKQVNMTSAAGLS